MSNPDGSEVTQVQRLQRLEIVFALLVSGASRQERIFYEYLEKKI